MKYLVLTISLLLMYNIVSSQDIMVLKSSGKVVIGNPTLMTTPGPYNLYVQNGMMTEKVKVAVKNALDWSDHAFELTPSLEQVQKSIHENSHLINMPSANQLVKEGYELQAMDAKILEQVEWLWQYTLKLSEENKTMKTELAELKKMIEEIQKK